MSNNHKSHRAIYLALALTYLAARFGADKELIYAVLAGLYALLAFAI